MYEGQARHPVMVALAPTVEEFAIPIEPFEALISAFEQDQNVTEYATYDQLLDYCTRSANPVGHLVLYLGRSFDPENARLSDATCTGLQLANFWQDVARDLGDRPDLPAQRRTARRSAIPTPICRPSGSPRGSPTCSASRSSRARELLHQGRPLIGRMPRALAVDVDLFSRGGLAILDRIEAQGFDVLSRRPKVGKLAKFGLLARALLVASFGPIDGPANRGAGLVSDLRASYAFCERLSRSRGQELLLQLPSAAIGPTRGDVCPLRLPPPAPTTSPTSPARSARRSGRSTAWRRSLDDALGGRARRLARPARAGRHGRALRRSPRVYLHEVIDGVEMDLEPRPFATFDELYGYCYRVASVVGLSCLHIWGYRSDGGKAEALAEACGVALQLTNILRDVREDALNGRVYLPARRPGPVRRSTRPSWPRPGRPVASAPSSNFRGLAPTITIGWPSRLSTESIRSAARSCWRSSGSTGPSSTRSSAATTTS